MGALIAGPCMLPAPPAQAASFTESRTQVTASLDYGLYLGGAEADIPSPFGAGLGAKAGYTLASKLYLGAEANYFFGASRRFPEYGDVQGSLRILHYGAELGYDVGLGSSWVLRPKLGFGAARMTVVVQVEGLSGDVSETGMALTAGTGVLWRWGVAFLTAEARYAYLRVDTRALEGIPGLELERTASLDGLLLGAGGGVTF